MPWVYLLRCADDTLYCGWTVDLDKRLAAHNAGTASRYTRRRLPVELAWSQEHPDRSSAMRAEAAIKKLPRPDKLALAGGEVADRSVPGRPGALNRGSRRSSSSRRRSAAP